MSDLYRDLVINILKQPIYVIFIIIGLIAIFIKMLKFFKIKKDK